ncbi:fimbrial protein [uncultured Citrobacter sp.]|uniref:fimbrial protein n=1 Tax=uncultured Citrobacter sp. TaxID=200446 RepID=UPI0025979EE9|nr:fimbrial protein [uncultured Citrobacter sp.]
MKLVCRFIFFLTVLFSSSGFACSGLVWDATTANQTISINNIFVQRDTPVGSVIASVNGTPSWPGFYYYADYCDMYAVMEYNGAQLSGYDHVYNTNVSGVGIRIKMATWSFGSGYASAAPGSLFSTISGNGGYGVYPPTVELVKTGNIISGALQPGAVTKMYAANNTYTGTVPSEVSWTLTTATQITQVACGITSGNSLSFPIGVVQGGQFTQKGTVSKEKTTVDLKLDCDPQANINITLNGTQNPDTNDSSVLTLTNQGQDGIAHGVGVQLVYNGTPLKLNERLVVKHSSGGQETFPITAQYIQTKDSVRPGIANATATLNLTYQ